MVETTKSKTKKRVLSLFLGMLVLIASLMFAGITSFAGGDIYTGDFTYGDYGYKVLSDGTAEIVKYKGTAAELTIPSKFDNYTVTSIGSGAFSGCHSLKSIIIPNSVTNIGEGAFSNCSLSKITIPNSVTKISYFMFENCLGLTSVTIPNSVTNIDGFAFSNCSNLTSITIPNSVTSIGSFAFGDCSSLTSVIIPSSVKSIDISAFSSCLNLASVTISNGVTSIGDSAFSGCSKLSKVTMPSSVTSIGKGVFSGCSKLTSINVDTNNKKYSSKDGVLFNKNKTVLISYPNGNTSTSYSIPNSVTSIGDSAFSSCSNLTSITIPNSVTSIGSSAFSSCSKLTGITIPKSVTSLDSGTFSYCKKLTCINVDANNKKYSSQDGILFNKNKTELIKYPANKKGSTYEIPNTVTTVGSSYVFSDCSNLKTLIIGKSVKKLAFSALITPTLGARFDTYYTGTREEFDKILVSVRTSLVDSVLDDGLKSFGGTPLELLDYLKIAIHYNYIPQLATPKLSSVTNTASGVQIKWGKITDAEKYRIFYKTGNGKWKKLADTTSTSYTWKNAKSGTKYSFTVRCISSDGKTYTSAYDTKGKSITYVAAPKLSSVTNTTSGVKISWGKVAGAAKYRIFYKTGDGKWKKLTDTASTSYTWKKAKSGTKYSFTVRCISKDGKSYTSAYDTKGKSLTFVSAPKISKLSKTSSGIKISWDKVNGAAKYRIFYKTANGKWKKLTDTTSTSYTWKGAKKGTTYSFTVRCISKDGKTYTSAYDTKGKSIKR